MLALINLIKYVVLLGVVPYLNFHYWRQYGRIAAQHDLQRQCATEGISGEDSRMNRAGAHSAVSLIGAKAPKPKRACAEPAPVKPVTGSSCPQVISEDGYGKISKVDSKLFGEYKGEHLIQLKSPSITTTVVDINTPRAKLQSNPTKALREVHSECSVVVNPTASLKKDCLAVVGADIGNAFNRLRIGIRDEKTGALVRPTRLNGSSAYAPSGFFGMGHMGGPIGRTNLLARLGPLLTNLDALEELVAQALKTRDIHKGDDVVLVVLNDGEIDIFLNFACSLRAHALERVLHKVVVFAASSELVHLVQSAGATGIYHPSFFDVNRGASYTYLDKTFTDMMWYKSFSLWVMLKQGYNVLFQDADLVWFRDPFPYFHRVLREENTLVTFFSDDGQRSMRYTPFYANSGFYYLPSDKHTTSFAYQIVMAFDSLYTMGSHQNIFTTKLTEMMDMGGVTSRMLDLALFPTGVQYHHNKKFMERLLANNYSESPYGFHMCWTANKRDKIKYFKETGMWYLQDKCYISDLTPAAAKSPKSMFNKIMQEHNAAPGSKPAMDNCCIPKGSNKFTVFKSKDTV